jgi:hypothetical protein
MTSKSLTRSFAGGELSEQLFGRLDLGKHQTGLARAINFLIAPQGPAMNRPGFEFVRAVKNSAVSTRLLPFTYSSTQTMIIEMGAGYFRFHTGGATVLSGGVPYEVANTYLAAELFDIHYVQSADVLTLVHPNHPPRELRRLGATNWVLSNISFVPTIAAPAAVTLVAVPAGGGGGTFYTAHTYVATAVKSETLEESLASPSATASLDLTLAGNYITIQPANVLGAIRYNIYKSISGLFGYIGQTDGSAFRDDNITPDVTQTPQLVNNPFASGAITSVPVTSGGTAYGTTAVSGGAVTGATILESGSGYSSPHPTVTLAGGAGTGAALTSTIGAAGGIFLATVTAGGSGYTSAPTVIPSGGGGSGATFTVALTADAVTSITITNGGIGYTSNPTLELVGGGGTGATATANYGNNGIASVAVTAGGSGYTSSPTVTIAGAGDAASVTAQISTPVFDTPTLTVTDTFGTGATLEAVVAGGVITGVRVLTPGSGYVAPVVTVLSAAGGSGATFGAPALSSAEVFPSAVSYFEQRRVFGGSTSKPQTLWMTRSGTESNMGYSIPTRSDDSITARIVAREANTIRHLVPLGDLLALTSGGEWRITSANSDVLTPSNISVKPQGYVGSSNAQPVTTSKSVLYSQARGSRVRELTYSWQQQGYDSVDVSILAPHLFDYKSITQLAYSKAPNQILWAVRSDGVLLGMTHAPEHEVKAWHQHTTNGSFESVAVVAEGEEDAVYAVVRRTIGGGSVRYIERMHSRNFAALADSFFVDAGSTYSGAAATVISGLSHLEGATVAILADGGVEPPQVVTSGTITLTAAASKVHVGLAYDADAQGMPLSMDAVQGLGQGTAKNITKAWLRVSQSSSIKAGPSFDRLREYPQRTPAVPYGSPPALVTAVIPINLPADWSQDAQWCVRQSDPLPITLQAITLEFASGG